MTALPPVLTCFMKCCHNIHVAVLLKEFVWVCVSSFVWWPADDENDAVLFEKIKKGEYDADDPIWDNVSMPAKDLVVG